MAPIVSSGSQPMSSAPFRYQDDGSVDWGNMWDSFCELARDGGPPHRATLLDVTPCADSTDPAYQAAACEIARGIKAVSGLSAEAAEPGWLRVRCASPGMADWLARSIVEENVVARSEGDLLYVPVGANYSVSGEIKNVITAVAKTTHYFADHVPDEVKRAMVIEERIARVTRTVRGWFGRG